VRRTPLFVCLTLFLVAYLPRLAYVLLSESTFDGYHWRVADSLLAQGALAMDGVATTQYEPLYPMFLAAARAVSGERLQVVRALQAAVDALGAVFLYLLAAQLTGRRRAAVLSVLLFAGYPLLVRHAGVAGEFALLSTLLIAFAYAMSRIDGMKWAAIAGACLGLAILTRSGVAPLLVMTAAVLIGGGRRGAAATLALVTCVLVAPWLIRNYRLNGSMWPTRSGLNLFIGNSEYTAAMLPEHSPDLLMPYANATITAERVSDTERSLLRFNVQRAPDVPGWRAPALLASSPEEERVIDARLMRLALDYIKANPAEIAWLKVKNLAYFFWPRLVPSRVPLPETEVALEGDGRVRVEHSPVRATLDELAYSIPYLFVLAAALPGVWSRRRSLHLDACLWCIVASFVITHAVYFPATRYRAPMEFVLLFYAAVGIDAWLTREESAT
jgi:4-amino-4-deoxy-L-arabinose transferase-like glycosyltransferase